jgi:cation diffusion facilitator CzcD-associated flavoprotein CzcO
MRTDSLRLHRSNVNIIIQGRANREQQYMPLLEEMGYMPKHKYAYGTELREYAESIADRFELRDKTMFRVEMKNLTWDDNEKEWIVKMTQTRTGHEDSQLTVRALFVIAASGLLNCPQLPGIPGIEKFRGHGFHTSRWDYNYTGGSPADPSLAKLKEKTVGIIGTGATAIQAVPHLGKWAKELYVFQRTPSSVDERGNRPTDVEWWTREIAGQKGWQRRRNDNFNAFITNASPPPPVNMVDDAWTKMPSFSGLVGGPPLVTMDTVAARVGALHALDFPRQERIRHRVEQIVKDKEVADKLKAWYPGWCKRPCFHDDYLPTFNLSNVTLVDTDGKGVDSITENAVVVGGMEYKVDLLIFSTGFRSPSSGASPGFRAGISIVGRDGQSLDEKLAGGGSTFHGVLSRGFPNLFWPGPLQAGASGNQIFVLDQLATHIAYIVSESARRAAQEQKLVQKFSIEPTAEAEEEWAMQILYRAAAFAGLAGCTPSYLNREGEMDRISKPEDQIKAARAAIWGEGIMGYVETIEGWRKQGNLGGLEVTVAG